MNYSVEGSVYLIFAMLCKSGVLQSVGKCCVDRQCKDVGQEDAE